MSELSNHALRKEMVGICPPHELERHQPGHRPATCRARIDGGFLITPTSLPYDRMEAEDIVEMALRRHL